MHRRTFLKLAGLSAVGGMTLGRRLLMAGGGTAAFNPPPPVVTLTTAPEGGWTQIPDAKAVSFNGSTFLSWIEGSGGASRIAAYDEASRTTSSPVTIATGLTDEGPPDLHNSGAILVRSSDSRIVTAYCGHEDTRVRVRISTNPEDVSSFGTEQVLDPGFGGVYTYCTLHQLTGVTNDPIYLFARSITNLGSQTGRLVYAKSTDQGATWSSWTVLFTGASLNVPYWRIGSDQDRYIHVLTTNTAPSASNLYHFYLDGTTDKIYKSDGTEITASKPVLYTDLTNIINSGGSSWSWGVCVQANGKPAGVVMQDRGSDNAIMSIRWTGLAWTVTEVVASVGGYLGINQFASGAAIHKTDPDIIYASRKVAGIFELFRYTSPDSGATWVETQLTFGSAHDNAWVDTVTNPGRLVAVWLYGDYTNDTNYDFGIRGLRA